MMVQRYKPPAFPTGPTCDLVPLVMLRHPKDVDDHIVVYVIRDGEIDGGLLAYRMQKGTCKMVPVSRSLYGGYIVVSNGDQPFTLTGNVLPWIRRLIEGGVRQTEAVTEVLGLMHAVKLIGGPGLVVELLSVMQDLHDVGVLRRVRQYVDHDAPRGSFTADDYRRQREITRCVALAWAQQNVPLPK